MTKPSLHIETRKKLKDIASITSYNELIEQTTLNELEKDMLRMYYLEGKSFCFIGDELGYSESGIKKIHNRALKKIQKIIK